MTEKEIRMQMALGTIEFDKLSRNEQAYYLIITRALIFDKPWPCTDDSTDSKRYPGTRTPDQIDPRPYKDCKTGF